MKYLKYNTSFYILIMLPFLWSCNQKTQWEGQKPVSKVNTQTVPIQLQHKGVFDLGKGVFASNEFDGARLNGVARTNDTLITVLLTPENEPINMSPWFAFKLWSEIESEIFVKLTYPENASHRYYPKLSFDGLSWKTLDSANYQISRTTEIESMQIPKEIIMKLSINPDTLWVAAQELITSTHVENWISKLLTNTYVTKTKIGESHKGKPINLLKIGESDDQKMIFILSRQHPPEVTGYLAMKAFVETICSDNEIAKNFRKKYNTYVVPLANPDGVDNGHWRHNYGGVDLNRDWADFNQPETSAIRDFMKQKTANTSGKFYFAVDFHSTWQDIYYTISPELKGNMPGLVSDMITATGNEFTDYEPNIKPSDDLDTRITSTKFFFYEFGAESLTFEIGDNTPREFVKKKGGVSALKLMELLLE